MRVVFRGANLFQGLTELSRHETVVSKKTYQALEPVHVVLVMTHDEEMLDPFTIDLLGDYLFHSHLEAALGVVISDRQTVNDHRRVQAFQDSVWIERRTNSEDKEP